VLWIILCFLLFKNPVFADFEATPTPVPPTLIPTPVPTIIPTIILTPTPSVSIVINKFQSDPPMTGMKEWVELFNKTENEIDLSIYQLSDSSDIKTHVKSLTGTIPAKGFFKYYEEVGGWLNNPGDTISLLKIGETIDKVSYTVGTKKITVNTNIISNLYSDLKGKWIGRSPDGSDNWQVFSDTDPPVGGGINYFNGYKTVVENVGVTIISATDQSGIGITTIITKMADLLNNNCINFVVDVGNSLNDGKCYKFEYVAIDGVGNTGVFSSEAVVKFDTSKPENFKINSAFRNILKLKSEFLANDPQSGVAGYKYGLGNLNCGSTIVPDNWSYIYNSILNIGYSGNPLSILGKAVNNAGLESEINCLDFITDLVAPKVDRQTNPEKGKYKIGDKLPLSLEFSEAIETINPELFKIDKFNFVDKNNNILNFEYEVKSGDLTDNLKIGETKITVNGGQITDIAGNEADLKINNIDDGVEIDGIVPLISLVGETYVEVPQFGNYLDLGVTASDVPDGDLTNKIKTENNVDINLGGIYEVKYSVTDDAGNIASVIRKIKVVDTTPPTIKILSDVENREFNLNSSEEGNLEWQGKCHGENKSLKNGNNVIKIKNEGDGTYDNCEIRAWDKWGNVSGWEKIDSFVIDTTPPIINFILPTPDNNVFVKDDVNIAIDSNEKLKECFLEKENTDNWEGDWTVDLKNQDLMKKSMEQKINMESDGVLTFWWRVSSEKDWDYLKFYIDGVLMNKISGEVPWQQQKYNLNVGEHIIKFIYSKDYSNESGEDTGWVDKVEISGDERVTPMNIIDNNAFGKLNNLTSGSTIYKVSCTDLFDNKAVSEERKVIKESEKILENVTPTPTPYSIFKTSAIVPTIKLAKPTSVKTTTKKSASILGVATTLNPKTTITIAPTTKLKTKLPWEEIKFWGMGMLALGITSGVMLLDKKVI